MHLLIRFAVMVFNLDIQFIYLIDRLYSTNEKFCIIWNSLSQIFNSLIRNVLNL